MVLFIGLVSCAPSANAIQTANTGTQAIESAVKQQTAEAVQAATQTQETMLAATETSNAKALSVSQTQTATTLSVSQTQVASHKCTPGGTYIDVEGDVNIDYMDILKVDTTLEKEVLTVTFYVKGLPDKITVNQDYDWCARIDVDNNPETGLQGGSGIDYMLCLFSDKHSGIPITGISSALHKCQKNKCDPSHITVTSFVDYEKNTIKLSAKVPGINERSILTFQAHDTEPNSDYINDFLCN